MKSLEIMSPHEVFDRLKCDLIELHALAKEPLDKISMPQIVKLHGRIFMCTHRLQRNLKVLFKRNLLGIIEDFEDYNLETPPTERREFQQILLKNLNQLIHDLDHAMLKRKAA